MDKKNGIVSLPMDEDETTEEIVEETVEQEETEESEYDFTMELKKPLRYNGIDYDVLHFDFSNLTGKDLLQVQREARKSGKSSGSVVLWQNEEIIMRLAVRASVEKIGYDGLERLPLRDAATLQMKVQNFMLV